MCVLVETVTLHAPDGLIVWHWSKGGESFGEPRCVGTYPWEWISPLDHRTAKEAFGMALICQSLGPVRYRLSPEKFSGEWIVETQWLKVPSPTVPIIGVSRTWSAVAEHLSNREKQIAKLLPDFTVKEIARTLGISSSTVDTFRARLNDKLRLSGGQLIAWCQSHRDIL